MVEVMKVIQERHSFRGPIDRKHQLSKKDLLQILEAARWAPTAHNMQNFEIIVVDDRDQLERLGMIESKISQDFLEENYQLLSFSPEELLKKKVGILGSSFPPSWRTPGDWSKVAREIGPIPLDHTIKGSPTVLIVAYDTRKRAPASEGDLLGLISLGCVMENIWLTAQALGISLQIMSVFSGGSVEGEVKKILHVPDHMGIAYALRLGYPISEPHKMLRVRRDVAEFAHHNQFGNRGFA